MQRNPPVPSDRPPSRRVPGGICLLLLYLLTATPLAPILTALLAVSDPCHQVTLQQAARGLQVVLRHRGNQSPAHHHGVIAGTLTLFARRASPSQSDHVIQFGPAEPLQRVAAVAVTPAVDLRILASVATSPALPSPIGFTSLPAALSRPPPVTSALLLAVRSPVLVL